VKVHGRAWTEGSCDEGSGCGSTGGSTEPLQDITVSLRRKGVAIQTTTVDGPEFEVRLQTEGLTPGDFRIFAEQGQWEVSERLTVAEPDRGAGS
jgi:hypothetical protein